MRSEQVFRARERLANKYLLCQAAAKTTRRLHFASFDTTDAITDAFVRIATDSSPCFPCDVSDAPDAMSAIPPCSQPVSIVHRVA